MEDFLKKVESHFTIHFMGDGTGGLGKVLASETSLKILDTLSQGDDEIGVTAAELSKSLGIARTTVIYHLGRLQETGLAALNPALSDWEPFWEDYRKGRSRISKEDFNRIHGAKMKGEKLYLPTRKGVLFLPTDQATGEAILMDAFTAINQPQVETYQNSLKSAAATGLLGIFFLAVSFMFTPGMVPLPGIASDYAPLAEPAPVAEMAAAPMAAMVEEVPTEAEMATLTVTGDGDVPQSTRMEKSAAQDMAAEEREVVEEEPATTTEMPHESPTPQVYEPAPREIGLGSYIYPVMKYLGVLLMGVALAMAITAYRQGRPGKTI